MFEHGESSRPREEVREDVPETAVDTWDIVTDVITVSYATILGYVMPPILRDDTPEEQRGDYRDVQLDTIQPRMTEPYVEMEVEAREEPTAIPAEDDSDAEYRGRSSTPVRGGVMRFDGYTDSEDDDAADDDDAGDDDHDDDDDEDHDDDDDDQSAGYDADRDPDEDGDDAVTVPETDPKEDPEEAPAEEDPTGYFDGMGTTADDIIESSTARIEELEEQVQHLEEQDAAHQYVEDQYREVAY